MCVRRRTRAVCVNNLRFSNGHREIEINFPFDPLSMCSAALCALSMASPIDWSCVRAREFTCEFTCMNDGVPFQSDEHVSDAHTHTRSFYLAKQVGKYGETGIDWICFSGWAWMNGSRRAVLILYSVYSSLSIWHMIHNVQFRVRRITAAADKSSQSTKKSDRA